MRGNRAPLKAAIFPQCFSDPHSGENAGELPEESAFGDTVADGVDDLWALPWPLAISARTLSGLETMAAKPPSPFLAGSKVTE